MTSWPRPAAHAQTDPTGAEARLQRLLGAEPVAWLVQRARDRLEAGRPMDGVVTLAAATAEQRRAVERHRAGSPFR